MNSLPWQLIWSAAKLQLSVQVRAGSPAADSAPRRYRISANPVRFGPQDHRIQFETWKQVFF